MAEECEQARLHVPVPAVRRDSVENFAQSNALPGTGAQTDRRVGFRPCASSG